ncbi:MAG: hypothetical protein JRL30_01195 [Deltaproteobacteria bacterium]|nr:hypothetical protein [Deltaproteobacteria bacterium]
MKKAKNWYDEHLGRAADGRLYWRLPEVEEGHCCACGDDMHSYQSPRSSYQSTSALHEKPVHGDGVFCTDCAGVRAAAGLRFLLKEAAKSMNADPVMKKIRKAEKKEAAARTAGLKQPWWNDPRVRTMEQAAHHSSKNDPRLPNYTLKFTPKENRAMKTMESASKALDATVDYRETLNGWARVGDWGKPEVKRFQKTAATFCKSLGGTFTAAEEV